MSRILFVPKSLLWVAAFVLVTSSLAAQDEPAADQPESKFSFGMIANLGNETIDGTNFQYLGLIPDFGYGPWGVGIDLSFHFRFYKEPAGDFGIYPRAKDWWDSDATTIENLNKYLARIAYIRYGKKGDPLYAQLGTLPSTTLGTGFIVNGYNNGILKPETRLTGLNLDVSGSLFGVPWVGEEAFVADISTFNLEGIRIYTKPFGPLGFENPILKELQVGFTAVVDTDPYARTASELVDVLPPDGTVLVLGADSIAPLYSSDAFTARATLDLTAEGSNLGSSLGVDGTLVKFITWGLQGRALGDNFIPSYFDQGYEINRGEKYLIYNGDVELPGSLGWQAALGTSFLEGAFSAGVVLSGTFGDTDLLAAQPQLVGYANVKHGVLPVDLNAYYQKRGVVSFSELSSPENALIGAKLGWPIGAVTLSIVYDLRYVDVPVDGKNWVTTSKLETSVKMF